MSKYKAINAQLNISDIVGSTDKYVKCPFHDDNSASMVVNHDSNTYKCFASSCGASGDAISYYAHINDISMSEAAAELADKYGIDCDIKIDQNLKKKTDFVSLCHDRLMSGEYKNHEKYLIGRGIERSSFEEFKLGVYKSNVVIPIYSETGKLVATNSRSIYEKSFYIADDFDKSNYLPGLNKAKRRKKPVYIVESMYDMIQIFQEDGAAVALLGSDFSAVRAGKLVSCGVVDVILALDDDSSGIKSSLNILIELQKCDPNISIRFINLDNGYKDIGEALSDGKYLEDIEVLGFVDWAFSRIDHKEIMSTLNKYSSRIRKKLDIAEYADKLGVLPADVKGDL